MRAGLWIFALSGAFYACSLADNPREGRSQGPEARRVATARLLLSKGDIAASWGDPLSDDLVNGVEWSALLEGRSVGGALIRMLEIDDKILKPVRVIPDDLSIRQPRISSSGRFLCYRRELNGDAGPGGAWIAQLPDPKGGGASSEAFELDIEGGFERFSWSPSAPRFAYYQPERRLIVLGEAKATGRSVEVKILARLKPDVEHFECRQLAWIGDGRRLISIWRLASQRTTAWLYDVTAPGPLIQRPLPGSGETDLIELAPAPTRLAPEVNRVLVEARRVASADDDERRFLIWDLETNETEDLPALSQGFVSARWSGVGQRISASAVRAGIRQASGSRWESWRILVLTLDQARERGSGEPVELPLNLAVFDLNQYSQELDERFRWLANGEVAAYIDPDRRRSIKLIDLYGEDKGTLLSDRDLSYPEIRWFQVVSSRADPVDPATRRDHLYFLERGVRGNLKRIEVTPLGDTER